MTEFFAAVLLFAALVAGLVFIKKANGNGRISIGVAGLTPAMFYEVGEQMLYPDKHGRYQRRGEVVHISGTTVRLRCGHENNATFPRPLASLRRSAFCA